MAVLVEVHNARRTRSHALRLKTPLIGINSTATCARSKTRLDITLGLVEARIPPDRIVITESGILRPEDVSLMRANGVDCFLVGEAFMRAPDPGGVELARLFEPRRA